MARILTGFFSTAIGAIFLLSMWTLFLVLPVKWLWNYLFVDQSILGEIHLSRIDGWQAMAILFLSGLLFSRKGSGSK